MIKSWEELGDHLAEIENRLSYLENSANNTQVGDIEERLSKIESLLESQPQRTDNKGETTKQIRAMVLYLQRKLNQHMDKKKVDKQDYDPF